MKLGAYRKEYYKYYKGKYLLSPGEYDLSVHISIALFQEYELSNSRKVQKKYKDENGKPIKVHSELKNTSFVVQE